MTQPINTIDDDVLLEQVGDRWPEMSRAMVTYRDPRRCQRKYAKVKRLLIQYVEKHGSELNE